ncbi:MAG: UDP-N-acetylmuramoyl-L-alanine--D-glutamate ligase, partial [Lachnospiraceae bacterium]|nr:UDP-N-acetylmuramoyl-L-alanine--D-glutamate ligase [Lachnospiraceae bacterium]
MDFRGKKVFIIGSGKSGIGALSALCHVKAVCTVYDGNEKLTEESVRSRFPEETDADVIIGEVSDEMLAGFDLAVISPGVPIDSPL